ncbi:hypothetical protein LSH36_138g06032 [Paralvinella palmiformis]|uniref:Uncharacterized protein n=1 Tax=Paralvinella palmiformis TaxID=53620 RepID=A0AAD9N7Y8_9ANNE|nr:hypothetical protein LSH36_138g06032 [Paralvinella palmiformis]
MFIIPYFSILVRWVSNIVARPGISSQVLAMPKERVATDPQNNSQCSVMTGTLNVNRWLDLWISELDPLIMMWWRQQRTLSLWLWDFKVIGRYQWGTS